MLSVPSFRAMGTIWEKCLARLATAHRWACQNTVPGVFKQDPESQQKIQQQLNPEFKGCFPEISWLSQLCAKDLNVQSCGSAGWIFGKRDSYGWSFQLLSEHESSEFNELMLGGLLKSMDFIWFHMISICRIGFFQCWDPGWRLAGFLGPKLWDQSESELPIHPGRLTAGT